MILRHGSLFSGIGGFDLAAEWVGWQNIFHCEWNPFGQRVLKHYWPNAESFTDITKTDFKKYANRIDILTGGFPCQPYSTAGKRLGKEDERHLWPEMLRAIREIQPRWVVGENVLGLVNWNGGLVFHEVQADLEAQGYEVLPFILPACAVNAPHRRDRVWFVASKNTVRSATNSESNGDRGKLRRMEGENDCNRQSEKRGENNNEFRNSCEERSATNTGDQGLQRNEQHRKNEGKDCKRGERISGTASKLYQGANWINFPTQSPVCNGNDGFSAELDGITFSKWRQESIKAGGNAIVPQVALQIFKAIEQFELLK